MFPVSICPLDGIFEASLGTSPPFSYSPFFILSPLLVRPPIIYFLLSHHFPFFFFISFLSSFSSLSFLLFHLFPSFFTFSFIPSLHKFFFLFWFCIVLWMCSLAPGEKNPLYSPPSPLNAPMHMLPPSPPGRVSAPDICGIWRVYFIPYIL